MRFLCIATLSAGLLLSLAGEAMALVCISDGPPPNSSARLIARFHEYLMQGAWVYLLDVFVIVCVYYILRRFKPSIRQKARWFLLIAGVAGMHAIQQRIIASTGGYCDGITQWQYHAELAAAWLIASLVFYAGYRLIMLTDERYRHFVAISTPIAVAIGLPALHFLYFTLTR